MKLHQLFIVWHCQPSVGVNIDYQNNPPSKRRHFHHPPLKQHILCQICSIFQVGLHQYPLQWSRRRCCSSACCFLLSIWVTDGLRVFSLLYSDETYVWVLVMKGDIMIKHYVTTNLDILTWTPTIIVYVQPYKMKIHVVLWFICI